MSCEHHDFEAWVQVGRITAEDGMADASPSRFVADVEIRCAACHKRFGFRGLDAGVHPERPTTSVFAQTLRVPLLSPTDLSLMGYPDDGEFSPPVEP